MSTCYNSNGQAAEDNAACDPDAEISACCGAGSVCVQNLYCLDPYGDKVPGTCTKQDWGSTEYEFCPCLPRYVGNSTLAYQDSVTFCYDGSYCCGWGNFKCCEQGQGWPIIDYGNAATIPTPAAGTALSTYYQSMAISTLPISPTSSNASPTSSGSGSIVVEMPSGATSTSTSTGTGSAQANTGLSTGAEVGIGIGAALGVAGLLAAAFMYYRLRKLSKPEQDKTHGFVEVSAKNGLLTNAHSTSELPTYRDADPIELAAR